MIPTKYMQISYLYFPDQRSGPFCDIPIKRRWDTFQVSLLASFSFNRYSHKCALASHDGIFLIVTSSTCISDHMKCMLKRSRSAFNPRPGRAFSITRPGRGWGGCDPPGVSKLSVTALREKDQSIALDEFSRLVVYFLTLDQHLI